MGDVREREMMEEREQRGLSLWGVWPCRGHHTLPTILLMLLHRAAPTHYGRGVGAPLLFSAWVTLRPYPSHCVGGGWFHMGILSTQGRIKRVAGAAKGKVDAGLRTSFA